MIGVVWGLHQLFRPGGDGLDAGRRPVWRLLLACCTVALAAAWPAPAAAAYPAAAANPVGAHSMLQLNSSPSLMQTMFAEAAAMHASAIRLDVAPALIFPNQGGQPDFEGLDEVMALSQQYHLRVVADLFTIPPWMAGCTATGQVAQSRCAPASNADYGSIITQIVTHADPVIRDWEIWNEPDTTAFFSGSPQQYALMLRTAHDAIKAVDPGAHVLLGGISAASGMSWLAQVLATPGADAAAAFDIANVHERGWLDGLVGDLVGWRWFLSAHGFSGPIWVTEHGYPADPAFQFDPRYKNGDASQAAYLSASIPSLVDAGAGEVFVTERDNLSGQFASEGLLGGDVTDTPAADPQVIERPAYAAVTHLADCYTLLGRDCPGSAPAVSPSAVFVPSLRLGSSAEKTVTVSDPGSGPLVVGARTVPGSAGLNLAHDSCPAVLEPDESCAVTVQATPTAPGTVLGQLEISSDSGATTVPVGGVAMSVSGLASPQLPAPRFSTGSRGAGVDVRQQLVLKLTNPLAATVHIGVASLAGPDAPRFRLVANTCRGKSLVPNASCQITVSFVPDHLGIVSALLSLSGDGLPLVVALHPAAIAPPSIKLLAPEQSRRRCPAPRFMVVTSQPAHVSWSAVRSTRAMDPRCARAANAHVVQGARASTRGRTRTGGKLAVARGHSGYLATVKLPSGLRPGVYRLTITPANQNGLGPARAFWVTVTA
jgi:hypothetical protein